MFPVVRTNERGRKCNDDPPHLRRDSETTERGLWGETSPHVIGATRNETIILTDL